MSSGTRRSTTRQKLYDAAVVLIAEQGFSSTTVEEIAERAGVAKGTVYYNFANKTELFEGLLRHSAGLLAAAFRQGAEETAGHGGTQEDALDAMLRAGLVFLDRHPALAQLYVAELWRTGRARRPALAAARREAVAAVEAVLLDGTGPGGPDAPADVHLTASALVGMVLVTALDWKVYQAERSLEDVHGALSLLVRGRTGALPRGGGHRGERVAPD